MGLAALARGESGQLVDLTPHDLDDPLEDGDAFVRLEPRRSILEQRVGRGERVLDVVGRLHRQRADDVETVGIDDFEHGISPGYSVQACSLIITFRMS